MNVFISTLRKLFSERLRVFFYNQITVFFRNTNPKQYATCGKHVDLNGPLYLDARRVYLEDYTRLQPGIRVISNQGTLHVKKYSAIGAGCVIIPGTHIPTVGQPQYLSTYHINDKDGDVIIEEDCWIGAGSYLLSHGKIGRGAIVAAAAVVTKPIPPYAVVAGAPAKIIACRFTIEQILLHEARLYPPEERMSKESLEELFKNHYEGKRHIGTHEIEEIKVLNIKKIKEQNKIPVYDE